jgi:ABC-type sugar transport system substrate-binding protein
MNVGQNRVGAGMAVAALLGLYAAPAYSADTEFAKKSPLRIGYSIQSAQDPYWQGYVHGIQDEMEKHGFT